MQTSCKPRADLVHTSCKPRADLVQTSCQPRADLVQTSCKPRATLCPRDLGKGWRGDLGTFMIGRSI